MGERNKKSLSFLDAAAEVLRRKQDALSVQDILAEAQRMGLLTSAGKTPDRTLAAALYTDVRARNSRFVRLSKKGPVRAVRNSVRWALKSQTRRRS